MVTITGKGKRKRNKSILFIIPIMLTLILFIISDLTKPVNSISQSVEVSIPAGSSNQRIAKILVDKKLIKSDLAFIFYSKFLGYDKKLKAGNYILDPSDSIPDILEKLSRGQVHYVLFTIPEGYNIDQIAETLSKKGLVEKEKFLTLASSSNFHFPIDKNINNVKYKLEGYLFPDTYQVSPDMNESDIIKMMLKRFSEVFDKKAQARAKELGLSDHELITLASMIEREAKFDEDRALIAGVIYNRLKIGMPLQIDATIQFALETPKPRLTYNDLEIDSPYNTYKNQGLPPGPIGAPGKASITAALYPQETDFLYYVAKNDGTHVFSKTLQEHNKAKRKYIK